MRRILLLLVLFCFALVAFGAQLQAEDAAKKEADKYDYVGAKKCKICHKKDGIFESWMHTKHAFAFDSLSADDQKKPELQKYYTTGTTAKGELLTGVQCESCHGAGSAYKKKKVMVDRKLAVENGLIVPDSTTCFTCHNDKAPAVLAAVAKGFDLEKLQVTGVHADAVKKEKAKK